MLFPEDLRYKVGYIGEEDETALFLYRLSVRGRSAVIPLSCLPNYMTDHTSDNNEDVVWMDDIGKQVTVAEFNALQRCATTCRALDIEPSWTNAVKMLNLIQSKVREVQVHPPRNSELILDAEMEVRIDGEKVNSGLVQSPGVEDSGFKLH